MKISKIQVAVGPCRKWYHEKPALRKFEDHILNENETTIKKHVPQIILAMIDHGPNSYAPVQKKDISIS